MREYIDEIAKFRVAGDWSVYVNILRNGSCHFTAEALNKHRRHDESVTLKKFGQSELDEIGEMQKYVAQHFGQTADFKDAAEAYLETLRQQFELD